MLNGKFFTGLPPKMIDRGAAGRNRLESHFFWPDDSKAESAVDAKIKRRNSMQACDRPLYEKQSSVEANDVDTKKRFSKEFSQSSIQFYDNLNDDKSTRRRPLLHSGGMKKTELAEKPTATTMELPNSVIDEAYTTAKKKQAYMSKIQFYDFINEEENNRKPLRAPKMDMNDKREMELNSKNSPKLQMKRDARSLSEEKEMPKLNNREVRTLQRSKHIKEDNVNRAPLRGDSVEKELYRRSEENSSNTGSQRSSLNKKNSYISERDKSSNTSPQRNSMNKTNSCVSERDIYQQSERYDNREDMYRSPEKSNASSSRSEVPAAVSRISNEREIYRKPNNSVLAKEDAHQFYRNSRDFREPEIYDNHRHFYHTNEQLEGFYEDPSYRNVRNDTKRYNNRSQYEYQNNRNYVAGYEDDIEKGMKMVRVQQSPPRRYPHYRDEEYYEQEGESPSYSRYRTSDIDQTIRKNVQQHFDYNEDERYEIDSPYEGAMRQNDNSRSSINRVTNKLNNQVDSRRDVSPPSELTCQVGAAPTNSSRSPTTTSPPSEINKSQKHLRSSLCFHDGAIIAENDAAWSPTSQQPMPRRNARSSAATKRVSVGLPD